MRKRALLLLTFLFIDMVLPCFSEVNKNYNNVFLEALGSAGAYSFNYERMVFNINDLGMLGIRIGFGLFFGDNISLDMPVMLVMCWGSEHIIELGVGFDPKFNFGDNVQILPTFLSAIGYRFSPLDGGLTYRVCFTPFFHPVDAAFSPWFGLSVGYIF